MLATQSSDRDGKGLLRCMLLTLRAEDILEKRKGKEKGWREGRCWCPHPGSRPAKIDPRALARSELAPTARHSPYRPSPRSAMSHIPQQQQEEYAFVQSQINKLASVPVQYGDDFTTPDEGKPRKAQLVDVSLVSPLLPPVRATESPRPS